MVVAAPKKMTMAESVMPRKGEIRPGFTRFVSVEHPGLEIVNARDKSFADRYKADEFRFFNGYLAVDDEATKAWIRGRFVARPGKGVYEDIGPVYLECSHRRCNFGTCNQDAYNHHIRRWHDD